MLLSTKAGTLAGLRWQIGSARIELLAYFAVAEWRQDRAACLVLARDIAAPRRCGIRRCGGEHRGIPSEPQDAEHSNPILNQHMGCPVALRIFGCL
jgi:hypothetical protein